LRRHFQSSVRQGIIIHIDIVIANSVWIVGTSEHINVWTDNWSGSPLFEMLTLPQHLLHMSIDFIGGFYS